MNFSLPILFADGTKKQRIMNQETKQEEYEECEKCGGELTVKIIGDESYDYCPECNWITP